MFKKFLIFPATLIMVIYSISSLSAEIIPLKKPSQTIEEKEYKLLKDALKPPIEIIQRVNCRIWS